MAMTCSHASAKLGAVVAGCSAVGSPPWWASLRYSKALWRASARVVYG